MFALGFFTFLSKYIFKKQNNLKKIKENERTHNFNSLLSLRISHIETSLPLPRPSGRPELQVQGYSW